ncbi:MAG: DUF2162 domain-containing protein [bacterium]
MNLSDLNIILWLGGMLFTLSIFALKVGIGLGFSKMKWRGTVLVLSLYLVCFVLISILSEQLIKILEPVLRKGPYLHGLMATGMIIWGIILIQNFTSQHSSNPKSRIQNPSCRHNSTFCISHSALLLIPCPVCLTAITFSSWAALNVIKFSALLVGLGLGTAFIVLSLSFSLFLKLFFLHSSLFSPRIGLGLGMMGIGLYFLTSLVLPAKIEEAREIYRSFLVNSSNLVVKDNLGLIALLFGAGIIGYLVKHEAKRTMPISRHKGG